MESSEPVVTCSFGRGLRGGAYYRTSFPNVPCMFGLVSLGLVPGTKGGHLRSFNKVVDGEIREEADARFQWLEEHGYLLLEWVQ